jgi:hypothetical protein
MRDMHGVISLNPYTLSIMKQYAPTLATAASFPPLRQILGVMKSRIRAREFAATLPEKRDAYAKLQEAASSSLRVALGCWNRLGIGS